MRASKFVKVEKQSGPGTAVCPCSNGGDSIVASKQEVMSHRPLFCSAQCEEFFATRNAFHKGREDANV